MEQLQSQRIVEILKILSNDTRLSLLGILLLKNSNVGEFTEILATSQPAISHHLRILKGAELITEYRKGLWSVYSINRKNDYFSLVQAVLNYYPSQKDKVDCLENKGMRIIYD